MNKANTKSMYEEVYNTIRDDVINGKYEGGTFLVEKDLCERFNVSRTPIREALIHLANDKFIEMIPNRGAYVPHITINDIVEICEMRAANEGLAAYRCAKKNTPDFIKALEESVAREEALLSDTSADPLEISKEDFMFHSLIMAACGNKRLSESLKLIDNQMHRFAKSSADSFAVHHSLATSLNYHKKVLDAIKVGNSEGANTWMEKHWFAMLNAYVERDLAGLLPKRI